MNKEETNNVISKHFIVGNIGNYVFVSLSLEINNEHFVIQ